MVTAYIGLASSEGDRVGYLREALSMLVEDPAIRIAQVSSFYESEPLEYPDQQWFVNAVARLDTALTPLELLDRLQSIEALLQQKRTIRWGPRIIDLDILLYDNALVSETRLQIPHVRLHDRAFVLVPLAEVAPDARHPILNLTAQEMLAQLPKKTTVNRLSAV